MSDKPNLRQDIRDYLRSRWEPVSGRRVAEYLRQPYEKVYDALKNLRARGEVEKDDMGRWVWANPSSIVPNNVGVIRRLDPDVAGIEEKVLQAQEDEPEVIRELAGQEAVGDMLADIEEREALRRVSMIPTEKLSEAAAELKAYRERMEQVDWDARDAQPDVEFKASMPIWVLRKVLDVLEAASREAKAAGRGTI